MPEKRGLNIERNLIAQILLASKVDVIMIPESTIKDLWIYTKDQKKSNL